MGYYDLDEELRAICEEDMHYQKGYSDGFKEGLRQAYEQIKGIYLTQPQPIVITVSKEEYERMKTYFPKY